MLAVLLAIVVAAGGAAGGAAVRMVLGSIPRGMALRPGPVELAGAAVTAVGVSVAVGQPRIGLVVFAGLLAVALTPVDAVHHRLPDAITLPAIGVAAALVVLTDVLAPGSGSLPRAAAVAAALWAVFAGIAWISPRSMGRGDVKLVPTLGLLTGYLGVAEAAAGVVLAFVLGAVVAVAGLATRRLTLRSTIPFGPFLLAGCWLSLTFPVVAQLARV
ncbi:prepilin peptidase [Nakamurella endophytica]|uniref:Prepilin type IV endopeptidase peptidase domain-containing protein n=1 Tax=Nakamurella endophytica TaxID=1748367 RepID=A0A917WNR6_9ACTN|nr:A24 family peptidase [Nakamurella endophytica]GGM17627.1 hypothetical protein GCM10011594_42170 [Nakamurella endophytica]